MMLRFVSFVRIGWMMLVLIVPFIASAQPATNAENFSKLDQTHDIPSLPSWGPYSKRYAGISHVPDVAGGLRFDVTAMPGYYRNKVMVPNVLFESGYYPWNITPDVSTVTYRYELEWKDKVYADISYLTLDSTKILVRMECVNRTSLPQALQLNLAGFLNYPETYPNKQALYPKGICYVPALKYAELVFANPRPSDHLVYDGWLRGEVRSSDFLSGSGIGKGFGKDAGDRVDYKIPSNDLPLKGGLTLRFRLRPEGRNSFKFSGSIDGTIEVKGTGDFQMVQLPYSTSKGPFVFSIASGGGDEMELDGFFIGSESEIQQIQIVPLEQKLKPEFAKDLDKRTLLFKYPDVKTYYGMAWSPSNSMVREVLDEDLDVVFKKYVHEHNYLELTGDGKGHYLNVFLRPVEVEPMGENVLYALICTGSKESVSSNLAQFSTDITPFLNQVKPMADPFSGDLKEGQSFQFSQNMMRTALMSNIVYPIYTQGQFIRHFTPGKWWNSLYTWDAGFIALGLAEIDVEKSIQCLNAYTTPEGSQSAFIHHGSPVPVQMYAFYDLWNKTQSKELVDYFYPRLMRYYKFMVGKSKGSKTNPFQSNLLKTWDYFYNSGGWDDYPPQKAVRDGHLEATVSPVITTAHMIRVAKMLRKVAQECGNKTDVKALDQDIRMFSEALQKVAWDEESGYFGYVVHNEGGKPVGFLKHGPSGANYNMGLDGAYPIFAGVCTPEQEQILLDKIFSEGHMWSKAGICVVDKQAPYYRIDGYWNGAVWMPHQWFIWKSMIDLGRTDLAWKIAERALEIWKRETDETYFTFEHWFAKTARGAGWHQFGALSAPVLSWYSAYYKPGTVTVGFETWIKKQLFDKDFTRYESELSFDDATRPHERSLLVVMNPNRTYKAFVNGQEVGVRSRFAGMLELTLPSGNKDCHLLIK